MTRELGVSLICFSLLCGIAVGESCSCWKTVDDTTSCIPRVTYEDTCESLCGSCTTRAGLLGNGPTKSVECAPPNPGRDDILFGPEKHCYLSGMCVYDTTTCEGGAFRCKTNVAGMSPFGWVMWHEEKAWGEHCP